VPARRRRDVHECDRALVFGHDARRQLAGDDLAEDAVAVGMLEDALRWRAEGPGRPLLRGDELTGELGLSSGPRVGRLLEELAEAQFAGELATREQALAYARERARSI